MNFLSRLSKEIVSDLRYRFRGGAIYGYKGFRILLYHAIMEERQIDDRMGLSITPAAFEMQMKYLKETGYKVIGLSDLVTTAKEYQRMPDKRIAITFDDGYKGIKRYAEPILNEYGFTATVFIAVDYIDGVAKDSDEYWLSWDFMDWSDIRSLKNISVGSHSMSHRRLKGLVREELEREIKGSKDIISERSGKEVFAFSYPHGSLDEEVADMVKDAGYAYACSSIKGINGYRLDPFKLRRTEITSFDNALHRFKKKIAGSYDWL